MHEDEGNNPAPRTKHRRQDNKGCSGSSLRRGLFAHVVLRQQAAGGKILRSGLPGPCSPALSSNGHRRKRWSGRGCRPQAALRSDGDFQGRTFAACLQRHKGAALEGLSRLVALVISSSKGEGRHAVRSAAKARARSWLPCNAVRGFHENRVLVGVSVRWDVVAEIVGR